MIEESNQDDLRSDVKSSWSLISPSQLSMIKTFIFYCNFTEENKLCFQGGRLKNKDAENAESVDSNELWYQLHSGRGCRGKMNGKFIERVTK